jgi:hypothetical protein
MKLLNIFIGHSLAKNLAKREDVQSDAAMCSDMSDSPFESMCGINSEEKACSSGKLCCWNGDTNKCHAKTDPTLFAITEGCDEGENDIGKCVLNDENFTKHLVERTEMATEEIDALKETVGELQDSNDGSDEAKSGLLDLFALSTMSSGNMGVGGAMGMASMINPSLMGVTQLMDSKYFTCPINIPHCQRIACYGEPGKNPQQSAMDCFGIPGCCFDSKAYQYKYLLGEQALKAPTCYKAIRTPMFHYFANNLAGKSTFVPNFLTYITSKVEDYINNDATFALLTRAHRCVNTNDIMSRLQLESYLARVWPAYTMMSLLDKKKDGNNQFLGSIVDAFSTKCGWKGITKTECMLIGCCYNVGTSYCSHPSDITKIEPKRLVDTISQLMMTGLIGDQMAEDMGAEESETTAPVPPTGMNTGSIPGTQAGATGAQSGKLGRANSLEFLLNGLTGRRRRSIGKKRPNRKRRQFEDIKGPEDNGSRSTNLLNMFGMGGMNPMGGMNNMGSMNQMGAMNQMGFNNMGTNPIGMAGMNQMNMGGMNPMAQAFGQNNAQNGGKMGVMDMTMLSMMSNAGDSNLAQTMMLANSLNGNQPMGGSSMFNGMAGLGNSMLGLNGNAQMCPADYKMDCVESPDGDSLNLSKMFQLQQKCQIKGCCWDSTLAQQATLQKNFDAMSQMMKLQCPYNIPASIGGLPDLSDDMRGCCDFSPCVHTSPPADWTNWGEWSICTEPCGGGIMRRSRSCEGHGSCPGMTSDDREQITEQQCNLQACESWSEWSVFGPCNTSCGPGNRMRSRSCFSHRLNQEVATAPGCIGLPVESTTCGNPACPTWVTWSQWSACSVSCGMGQRLRKRACTQVGLCPGESVNYERCGQSCFSAWSMWSACSATCLGGQQFRARDCIYSAETGTECIGLSEESKTCASNYCETWLSWSAWSTCLPLSPNQTCGSGNRSRSRTCTGVVGEPGCSGDVINSGQCSLGVCNWSDWQMASACETSRPGCGRGKASYVRTCPGGVGSCTGDSTKDDTCDLTPCPGYQEWSEWSECSVTCGTGLKMRSRSCNGQLHVDCLGSSEMKATCQAETKCQGSWGQSGWGRTNTWGQQTNNMQTNNMQTNTQTNSNPFGNMFGGLFGGQQADTSSLFNGGRLNNPNSMNMWNFVGRKKRSDEN